MPTFLLIGPSGAGKSSSAKHLAEAGPDIQVLDLDKQIKDEIGGASVSLHFGKIGNQRFFELSKAVIEDIAADADTVTLIVVGAGSIDYLAGHAWYLQQQLIALIGDPAVIYERGDRQTFHNTLDHYIASEFSQGREDLYHNAKFQIDVTDRSIEQAANAIWEIVNSV